MNYNVALEQIKKGQLKPIYLLHGEETYFIQKIEQAIIDAVLAPDERDMNLIVLDHTPAVNELIGLVETVPFMGGKNVIDIRGTELFRARKNADSNEETASENIDERLLNLISNMPEYAVLIFTTTAKVDKRRKLYKLLEKYGEVVELTNLKARDVRGWLNEKLIELNKKMSNEAIEYFLAITSVMPQISLGFLNNELDKVALFTQNKTNISKADLVMIMSSLPEISVFAMIDAVTQRQVGKALKLIEEQIKAGEHPLKLIALLSRQVRLLWQAKDLIEHGLSSREIAEKLGVVPFIGEKMMKQSRGFTIEKLKTAALSLAAADYELKSGQASQITLEKIIIQMCN